MSSPSHIIVIRDLVTGEEYLDQTPVVFGFADAVRALADAQIPTGFELARVECLDRAASRITDVTAKALNEVARSYEADNEPAGSFPRCLLTACADYDVVAADLDEEGAVDAGLIRAVQRRGDVLLNIVDCAA